MLWFPAEGEIQNPRKVNISLLNITTQSDNRREGSIKGQPRKHIGLLFGFMLPQLLKYHHCI